MSRFRAVAVLAALFSSMAVSAVESPPARDTFDHEDHGGAFPSCAACHRGASEPDRSMWPVASDCARCHDDDERDLVSWAPPETTGVSHVRFDHELHAEEEVGCVDCHSDPGAEWMSVRRAVAGQCLDCHGAPASHFDAEDDDCATCHRPLAEVTRLTAERLAGFPDPPSHTPDFSSEHGELAIRLRAGHPEVAASCATCHAPSFCLTCHDDMPE